MGLLLGACSGSEEAAQTVAADEGSALNGTSGDRDESPTSAPALPGPASGGEAPPAAPGASGSLAPSAAADEAAGAPLPGGNPRPGRAIEPGTLTAGAWDDNRNLDRFLEYRDELADQQMAGLPPSEEEAHRDAAARALQPAERITLDVALVIDTTGSMGDELAYLQLEFDAIAAAIEAQYPDSEQRWARRLP